MKNVNLKAIRIDGDTQSRVKLDDGAVADYAQALRDGHELPPVVVFFDGEENWLADGFHRYHAYTADKRASIPAEVRKGTQRDAMLFSFGANGAHGLRRSNEDKRKAVSRMLADAEWSKLSDRQIASHCAVTHPFVAGIRTPKEPAQIPMMPKGVVTVTTPLPKSEALESEPLPNRSDVRDVQRESEPEPDEPPNDGPDAAELAAAEAAEIAELEAMRKLLDSDDKLATVAAENKRLRAENSVLQLRVNGLMGEKNEAIRLSESWRRKHDKLAKQMKVAA